MSDQIVLEMPMQKVGEVNVPADAWDVTNTEKPKRVKKPKPIIRERKRRPKKGMEEEDTPKKFMQEIHNGHTFQIQYPETLDIEYGPELLKIQGVTKHGTMPYNPKGLIETENLTYLSVYRSLVSDELLQKLYQFCRSRRFGFSSDIAIRAHAATDDGKRLERLSYAKSTSEYKAPKFKLGGTPKPFQKVSAVYLKEAKMAFLADDMGCGKTIEAILGIACDMSERKTAGTTDKWLIVTPKTLAINWYKELHKWLPKKIKVSRVKNKYLKTDKKFKRLTKAQIKLGEVQTFPKLSRAAKLYLKETQIFIVPYDRIHRYSEYFSTLKFRGIIMDESHYVKGRSSRRTIAWKHFVENQREMELEYCWLLSGTPLMNRPTDLIPQLQILGRLQEFGGPNHFLTRYCSISTTDPAHVSAVHKAAKRKLAEENGEPIEEVDVVAEMQDQTIDQKMQDALTRKAYENMSTLNKALRSLCFIRREKADVLTDLAEKTRQTIALEITNRKDYLAIEADVISYIAELAGKDEKFLKSIKKYSRETQKAKIAERRSSAAFRAARAEALVKIETLKQCAVVGKLKSSIDWVEDFLESGKKLVIFATHNIILNELEEHFEERAVSIRSRMSPEARDKAVDQFNDNKKVKICICGLKMAQGLNMQKSCSDTLTIEFGWNPAVHDQAEDRVYRIGQRNSVMAYYHVAQRTIEERIGALIERKRRVVNAVASGDPLFGAQQGGVLQTEILEQLAGKKLL